MILFTPLKNGSGHWREWASTKWAELISEVWGTMRGCSHMRLLLSCGLSRCPQRLLLLRWCSQRLLLL